MWATCQSLQRKPLKNSPSWPFRAISQYFAMSSRWRTWRSTNRLANVRTKSIEAWTYIPTTYINDITWVFTCVHQFPGACHRRWEPRSARPTFSHAHPRVCCEISSLASIHYFFSLHLLLKSQIAMDHGRWLDRTRNPMKRPLVGPRFIQRLNLFLLLVFPVLLNETVMALVMTLLAKGEQHKRYAISYRIHGTMKTSQILPKKTKSHFAIKKNSPEISGHVLDVPATSFSDFPGVPKTHEAWIAQTPKLLLSQVPKHGN